MGCDVSFLVRVSDSMVTESSITNSDPIVRKRFISKLFSSSSFCLEKIYYDVFLQVS